MPNPIGISFLPSAENQAQQGPQQGQMEGDLASAFKILSLRLPRVLGAQSLAPSSLMNSAGSGGVMGGFNPYSAVFEALLKAAGLSGGSAGTPGMPGSTGTPGGTPPVRVGAGEAGRLPLPPPPTRVGVPTPVAPPQPMPPGGGARIGVPTPVAPPQRAPDVQTPSPFGMDRDFRSWNRGGRGY